MQAESGICAVTGTPDGPGRVGVSICDIAAGLNGFGAITAALAGRASAGAGAGVGESTGASLHVSLFSTASELMAVPCLQQLHTGAAPARVGLAHPSIAPYGAFETAEGEQVLISIQNEREWRSLCGVLGRPLMAAASRYATPTARLAHRMELDAELQALIGEWRRDALCDALRGAGVAYGAVNGVADVLAHPQLRSITYDAPSGEVTCIAPPVAEDTEQEARLGPVPVLGEHSDAIRAEFSA